MSFRTIRCLGLPVVGLLSALLAGCSAPGAEQAKRGQVPTSPQALQNVLSYFDQQWAMRRYWEDGLAEVATYDAERVIYRKSRRFEYTLITVKEEFNQQFNVKTSDYTREDLFPVMKVNQFCAIPAGQYPYHYLTSLFFGATSPWPCIR